MIECFNCKHGGSMIKNSKGEEFVPCKCEGVAKKEFTHEWSGKVYTDMGVENNRAETCEHYVMSIEIDNEDIEPEWSFDVSHTCPYCGHEDTLWGVNQSGREEIECESCGKTYEICWSYCD